MNKKILKAAIIFLGLFLAPASANIDHMLEESLASSLEQVEALYRAGKWSEAIERCGGIMKDAPKNHPAYFRAKDLVTLSLDARSREILQNEALEKQKQAQKTAQDLITEGAKLLAAHNPKEAEKRFYQASKLQGLDSQVWFLLGSAQMQSGKKRQAAESFKKSLEINPNNQRCLFHMAILSNEFKNDEEAEDYAKRLIQSINASLAELKGVFESQVAAKAKKQALSTAEKVKTLRSSLAQASLIYGSMRLKKKDYKNAAKAFDCVVKIVPSSAEAFYKLGVAQLHNKMYHQAVLALEQAVFIKETGLKSVLSKASALLNEGKSDEAVDAELKTRKLKDETAKLLYMLAIADERLHNQSEAIKNIEKAIKLKPDFYDARYTRAVFLAENGRLDEAIEQMRVLLAECAPKSAQAKKTIKTITAFMDMAVKRDNPQMAAKAVKKAEEKKDVALKNIPGISGAALQDDLSEVFERLRQIEKLINAQNYSEAIRRLIYLRSKHSDIADIHNILGHCYLETGRLDDAEKCFADAVAQNNNHTEALNNYAYVLALRGEKLDLALNCAQKAVEAEADRPEFLHTMGWALFKQGEVAESAKYFSRALEIKPNYVLARYNLGLALYLTQNYTGAIDAFNAVLAINPSHQKALMFKAVALAKQNRGEEAVAAIEKLKSETDSKSVFGKAVNNLYKKFKLAYERHEEIPAPKIASPAPIERLLAEAANYRKKGLVTRAKEKYLEAQRLAPERFEPYYELGEMYAEAGLNTAAISAWQQAERLEPNSYKLCLNLGKMHHKLLHPDKARGFFEKALSLCETEAEPHYYLGLLAYDAKNFESAESHALEALRLNPRFFKGMALAGMSRVRLNRLRPARDIYEALYAKAPEDSSIKRHARKKLWEITKLMAPKSFPSVDNALEVKEELVKKVNSGQNYAPKPEEIELVNSYGKNTMTVDDKAWVLRQLDKMGNVAVPTPIAPLKPTVSAQTIESKEKNWVVSKLQTFDSQKSKYALPKESIKNKYAMAAPAVFKAKRQPDKADDLVLEGLRLAEKGLINEALAQLEEAVKMSPNNTDALLNIGFIQTLQGNFKSAFDAYAQTVVLAPKEPIARLGLGNLYWLGGQSKEAVEQWKKINGKFLLSTEFSILHRSEKVWKRLLDVDPEDFDAHSNLGLVYMFSGAYNKALAEFKAAYQLEPSRREHEFYIAQVYMLKYLQKHRKEHRKEAVNILTALAAGDEAFPHAARLANAAQKIDIDS